MAPYAGHDPDVHGVSHWPVGPSHDSGLRLTASQTRVLAYLRAHTWTYPRTLRDALGMSQSAVWRATHGLEREGLIVARRNPLMWRAR